MYQTPYDILEVQLGASRDEITQAKRSLSKRWHPDRNPDNREEATERMKRINAAFDFLFDDRRKRNFDDFLKQSGWWDASPDERARHGDPREMNRARQEVVERQRRAREDQARRDAADAVRRAAEERARTVEQERARYGAHAGAQATPNEGPRSAPPPPSPPSTPSTPPRPPATVQPSRPRWGRRLGVPLLVVGGWALGILDPLLPSALRRSASAEGSVAAVTAADPAQKQLLIAELKRLNDVLGDRYLRTDRIPTRLPREFRRALDVRLQWAPDGTGWIGIATALADPALSCRSRVDVLRGRPPRERIICSRADVVR